MPPPRSLNRLATIGLIVLGLVAATLSAIALLWHRTPATVTGVASTVQTTSHAPTTSQHPTATSESASSSALDLPSATPTPQISVVIVGDSHSVGDPAATWVGAASAQLGWSPVVNLSAPGRGFLTNPSSCDGSPCAPFGGTVAAIAQLHPDLVVTFGGAADGDSAIGDQSRQYFADLRAALPQAKLVALSPITTEVAAPYWLTMHTQSIREAVEAVGGTFIDVGQPGLGNGEQLSAQAQAEIAQHVVTQLR